MKYVERYKLENAVEIQKAKVRFKVFSVAISSLIIIGIFLFIVSVGAMDFNSTRAFGAMAISVLLFLIAIGSCKVLDVDIFEVEDED